MGILQKLLSRSGAAARRLLTRLPRSLPVKVVIRARGTIPGGPARGRLSSLHITPTPMKLARMLVITVQNEKQNLQLDHDGEVIEFGRGPQRPDAPRCVIDDASVSRDHIHVKELPGSKV